MRTIQKFRIRPTLPERIRPLLDIAKNLWWSWNPEAISLFRRIDPELWRACQHNPITLLSKVKQERLDTLASKETFLAHLDRVIDRLEDYMSHPTWYSELKPDQSNSRIAYFSAEFGIHESLPFYAGGLGVLAGDHLKSASDLGLPLVGVGLLYRQGYFHQRLDQDGMQQEIYSEIHFSGLPMNVVRRPGGSPELISVEMENRKVQARIWRVQVGRIPLFLLDTDISENDPTDRRITHALYDADLEIRLRQEMLLGIGGLRALERLDLSPTVCHLNEGHSAFLSIERIASLMEAHQLDFSAAREAVTVSNVFTTHTPVAAGHDVFPADLAARYLEPMATRMDIPIDKILDLGRQTPGKQGEPLSMTILALRLSTFHNGVSKLHGEVARSMWHHLWPETPCDEVPIGHITNGVHLPSWHAEENSLLFDRYIGPDWRDNPVDTEVWKRVNTIPPAEMWRTRERLRTTLIAKSRRLLSEQLLHRGAHSPALRAAKEVLDPEVLTIGFARRFATYKRALLLFRDLDRFTRIIKNSQQPVQFIFAGKAHPKDQPGKEIIREIIHIAQRPEFRRHIVFLEDYDLNIARTMVQGVDIWLNTPKRPLEASGTSGMKVVVNGGLNLSILDGWWCEAYNGWNGWAIGNGDVNDDQDYQDCVESEALYNLLEEVIVPLFYKRGPDNLPRDWIEMIKNSMMSICPQFNMNRAAEQYTRQYYIPSLLNWEWLASDEMKRAKEIARWKSYIRSKWHEINFLDVKTNSGIDLTVGDRLTLNASVDLGSLSAQDVKLEVYYGQIEESDVIEGQSSLMTLAGSNGSVHEFTGMIPCRTSGHFGYSIRVAPRSAGLDDRFEKELITWWNADARTSGVLEHEAIRSAS